MGTVVNHGAGFLMLLANMFFIATLFPYLSVVRLPFDTQPYALLLAVLVLTGFMATGRLRLPRELGMLCIPALYAVFLWVFFGGSRFGALRSLAGYVSIFAISAAAYRTAGYLKVRVFIGAVFVWLVFGLIQRFVDREFGFWLVPRMSTEPYRGVTSLAAEPSHYAVVSIFFLLFNELFYSYGFYRRRDYLMVLVLTIVQIVLSLSFLGLILLAATLVSKSVGLLVARRPQRAGLGSVLMCGLAFGLLWLFVSGEYLVETRGGRLLGLFLEEPAAVLRDLSVADRIVHMVVPVYGFFASYGMGFGLARWEDHGYRLNAEVGEGMGGGVFDLAVSFGDRIMSGWGSALFELGIIGAVLIWCISWIFIRRALLDRSRRQLYFVFLFLIHVVMVSAVPLALPLFSFFVGLCARGVWQRESGVVAKHALLREIR